MDVRLADGSGIEATREIRADHPDTRVLMLTSFADDEALFASIMAGASGYVLKQVKSGDLLRAIRAVGAGDSLLDPSVTSAVLDRLRKGKHLMKDEKLARLSPQEERILTAGRRRQTNQEIGDELRLAEKTVKNYVSIILSKLEVARRAEAAAYLARHTTTPGLGRGVAPSPTRPPSICASTSRRMPPARKYSTSAAASMRTVTVEASCPRRRRRCASTVAVCPGVMPPSRPRTESVSVPSSPSVAGVSPAAVLQRQDAHAHQVRAVDALVALGDHEPHARAGSAPSPPSRGSSRCRTPCPASTAERRALGAGSARRRRRSLVTSPLGRCVVHDPSVPGRELVAQPDVRERAAHHHLVVPAPRRRRS